MMREDPILPQHPTPAGSDGVTVRCPDCGPVAVAAALTTIFGDVDSGAHHLTFLCPDCCRRATQFLPVQDVAALVLSGAALRALTRPAEADETTDAPPIGEDEVAAFAARLKQPGWENEMLY
jgi:hypothetical protein